MTIKKARRLLGKSSEHYTDDEIEYLIYQFNDLGGILMDIIDSKTSDEGPQIILN